MAGELLTAKGKYDNRYVVSVEIANPTSNEREVYVLGRCVDDKPRIVTFESDADFKAFIKSANKVVTPMDEVFTELFYKGEPRMHHISTFDKSIFGTDGILDVLNFYFDGIELSYIRCDGAQSKVWRSGGELINMKSIKIPDYYVDTDINEKIAKGDVLMCFRSSKVH